MMKSMLKLLTGAFAAILQSAPPVPAPVNPVTTTLAAGPRPMIAAPSHWPNRYNANTGPCDMISGPCACGAWHGLEDEWVRDGIAYFGLEARSI